MAPAVSVVVATHDRPERLARQLTALRGQDLPADEFEIVVVDDASSPETGELLRTQAVLQGNPALRVIRRAQSSGPAGARNAGWRAARAPLVAFTDDDCEATPGWLSALMRAAESNPGAFVQGPISANPADGVADRSFSHTLTSNRLGPWFETANILYPRDWLERLDGFDELAFSHAGGEDTDLAWRAMAAGARGVWEPAALMHHAVTDASWLDLLRRAWTWDETMLCFKRHPGLRRELHGGLFWTHAHLRLALALLAAAPRMPHLARALLVAPYLRRLYAGRQTPVVAPFRLLLDLTEMVACARGGLRYRVPVL